MASKGVVQAEELRLQLGDRLPVAMRLMAEAAKDAGLSTTGTVAEMGDLMKQGKLLSAQVLPHFATRMRNLARDNDALATALKYNLSPALGRAKLQLQEIQDTAFKSGIKGATMDMLELFGVFDEDMKAIARAIGAVVRGFGKLIALGSLTIAIYQDLKSAFFGAIDSMVVKTKEFFKPLDMIKSVIQSIKDGLAWITDWKLPTLPSLPSVPSMGSDSSAAAAYRNFSIGNSMKSAPVKVDLSVRGTDGLIEVVEEKVSSSQDALLTDAYNSMYGG